MAFQSPYRGEKTLLSGLSPRTRSMLSRGVLALVGGAMIYFSVRGLWAMWDIQQAAQAQAASGPAYGRFGRRTGVPGLPWVIFIALGLLGASALAAAIVPVHTMQTLFERWNRPPVTGDRSPHTDGHYRAYRWWPW